MLRDTIQTNERELRRWDHALVNEMVDAVVFSLPALEPWMPWALTSLGANEMRTASARGGTILTRKSLELWSFLAKFRPIRRVGGSAP